MDSLHKLGIGVGVSLAVVMTAAAPVSATSRDDITRGDSDKIVCTVKAVGGKNTVGEANSRWTLNADQTVASAKVLVDGHEDCKRDVTIAVWQAPDGDKGRPYELQKFYGYNTSKFGVGTHEVSIQLPDCFYQVDLVSGTDPKGIDGTPIYPVERMLASLHGGTKVCEDGTGGGEETPTVPQVPVTPVVEQPTELPSVGAGATVAIASIAAAIAGSTIQYARALRRG